MIKYIKRSDLDTAKYNACLDNSPNSRIYAHSWYLDIVATNWSVLVLDDYNAVMPLPWRQKYLIKYIYKPCWVQQLGVFSPNIIDEELVRTFISAIPRMFKKTSIQLNSNNPITGKGITKKANYILDLDKSYEELFNGYKSVRRRNVRLSIKNKTIVSRTENYIELINLFRILKKGEVSTKEEDYLKLEQLIHFLIENDKVDVLKAIGDNGELLGGAFFLRDFKRITYLFSIVSNKGREQNAMSDIIDSMIEKSANKKLTLDFEGSMIDGIAFFFKSFGAMDEGYYLYQENKIV
ncbi:MAG: hypothetical protein PSN34_08695 [Urechidicola sp.]|nr:hypothetical protein [Urechidicola sp.]